MYRDFQVPVTILPEDLLSPLEDLVLLPRGHPCVEALRAQVVLAPRGASAGPGSPPWSSPPAAAWRPWGLSPAQCKGPHSWSASNVSPHPRAACRCGWPSPELVWWLPKHRSTWLPGWLPVALACLLAGQRPCGCRSPRGQRRKLESSGELLLLFCMGPVWIPVAVLAARGYTGCHPGGLLHQSTVSLLLHVHSLGVNSMKVASRLTYICK